MAEIVDADIFIQRLEGTAANHPVRRGDNIVALLPVATASQPGIMSAAQAVVVSAITTDGSGNVGVGDPTIAARLHVKGSGSTSATTAFKVDDSADTVRLIVRNDGGIKAYSSILTTSGSSVFELLDDLGNVRTSITGGGSQTWYVSTAATYIGKIVYSTPGGRPGILFFDPNNLTRTQLKLLPDTGGFAFASHALGTIPTDRVFIKDSGVSIGINSSDARLVVEGAGSGSTTTTIKLNNSSDTESLSVRDDGLFSTSGGRIIGYDTITADATLTQSTKSCAVINPSAAGTVITMHLSPLAGIVQTTVNASAFTVTLGRNGEKMAGAEANYTLPANTSIMWQYFGATLGWLIISHAGELAFLLAGCFGGIHVHDATASQSIPAGAEYTKATCFTDNDPSSNCSSDAANDKITLTRTGYYRVFCSINFTCGTNNVVIKASAFLDGVEQDNVHAERKIGTGADIGSMSYVGIVDCTTQPIDLDMRFAHDAPGAVDITVKYSNLSVQWIGNT